MERTRIDDVQWNLLASNGILQKQKRNSAGRQLYPESVVAEIETMRKTGSVARPNAFKPVEIGSAQLHYTIVDNPKIPNTYYTEHESNEVCSRLAKNVPMNLIVLETKLHPMVVYAIKRDLDFLSGEHLYVDASVVGEINKMPLPGKFPVKTVSDLMNVLRAASEEIADRLKCAECGRSSVPTCPSCLKKKIVAKMKTTETNTPATETEKIELPTPVKATVEASSIPIPPTIEVEAPRRTRKAANG